MEKVCTKSTTSSVTLKLVHVVLFIIEAFCFEIISFLSDKILNKYMIDSQIHYFQHKVNCELHHGEINMRSGLLIPHVISFIPSSYLVRSIFNYFLVYANQQKKEFPLSLNQDS